jgi:DNA helicase-2/ATP-dependent DNA helicase PcrA
MSMKKRYLDARRRVIENEFSNLNTEQRKAVMATQGPLLLLAGAGSGKTTVIINRIVNLIKFGKASDCDELPADFDEENIALLEDYVKNPSEEKAEEVTALCALDPAEPWRIIAITFTNKAADELKKRLEAMVGERSLDIWASTFHSACVRILRRDIDKLGAYTTRFTIYDTSDCLSLVKHILKDLQIDEKNVLPRTVLSYISSAKDDMITPRAFLDGVVNSRDFKRKQIGEVYAEYAKRMLEANALDFDDLILMTVRLLSEYEDVRAFYQNKFKYVLVDEYQDTNRLQYKLVSLLAGKWGNICVVGDDDQGIYRFRGASIENILSFEDQYKNSRVIRLEQNYRSTSNILDAANAVISKNIARKGKELWTKNDRGEKITLVRSSDESDEAQYVAARMMEGFAKGVSWRDFAILYRMNAQSNQLEYAMKRNGIPYKVIGGTKFFDRAEVKDMLAYLCVINNVNDDLRLLRILNNPPRGIGGKTVETVTMVAGREACSIYEILKSARDYPELSSPAPKLLAFVNLIEDVRARLSDPLDEVYDALLRASGYEKTLDEKNTPENTARIENIRELKSNIVTYMKENETGGLSGFLDEIALYTDIEQYEAGADQVVMMTMHSAKGLEFPTVFIVGAEEGIFPGVRSIAEPEELEEERRLCYVAITRAKKKLYITAAKQRMLFGRTSANRISRFVDEIPEELIEKPAEAKPYSFGGEKLRTGSIQNQNRIIKQKSQASETVFRIGDRVRHSAFGEGFILSVSPMGGDALLEIAFDKVGTKRLMNNAASQHMTKI